MYRIYQDQLRNAFKSDKEEEYPKGVLVKGDISGIQEFIFNTPSTGAARLLKARSFFIQALSKLCIHKMLEKEKGELMIDSGGAFYLRFKNELNLKQLRTEINEPLLKYGLFISFSQANLEDGWEFAFKTIREYGEIERLHKYNGFSDIFEPEEALIKDVIEESRTINQWKEFAKNLSNSEGYKIEKSPASTNEIEISENSIGVWGLQLRLLKSPEEQWVKFNEQNSSSFIMKEMPIWEKENPYLQASKDPYSEVNKWENELKRQKGSDDDNGDGEDSYKEPRKGELIDLDHLALQGQMRTGTNKIGVLKLDVDNLGTLFRHTFNTYSKFLNASQALGYFFGSYLKEIWQKDFLDDVLIVYSGGDDCFALGAWDRVFDFAKRLQLEFESFTDNRLTFSASLMVLDAGYPVIRIGTEAESLLDKAKTSSEKNAINVFGEVFPWSDFKCAASIKNTLYNFIINKEESKSILQTIRLSAKGYEALLKGIKTRNNLNMQKVWNLSWFLLRKVSNQNKDEFDEKIVSVYHDAVLNALVSKNFTKALTYPMAARWTELLTRYK